jgi:hypothetical protein
VAMLLASSPAASVARASTAAARHGTSAMHSVISGSPTCAAAQCSLAAAAGTSTRPCDGPLAAAASRSLSCVAAGLLARLSTGPLLGAVLRSSARLSAGPLLSAASCSLARPLAGPLLGAVSALAPANLWARQHCCGRRCGGCQLVGCVSAWCALPALEPLSWSAVTPRCRRPCCCCPFAAGMRASPCRLLLLQENAHTLRQLHPLETRRGSCGIHPTAMTARRRGGVAARCHRRRVRP